MHFHYITLFEEFIDAYLQKGVLGQALKKNLFSYQTVNPRIFTEDIHKTVDDRPFGGGDGMVMLVEPLRKAIEAAIEQASKVSLSSDLKDLNNATDASDAVDPDKSAARPKLVVLSPQGKRIDHSWVLKNKDVKNWLFLCGRYAGIDHRLINHFEMEEVSVGDYVVSGGELPALIITDAILRQVPGVLGHAESAQQDSFFNGLLESPSFTRPEEILNQKVPSLLRSGDHGKIKAWRRHISLLSTLCKRADLILNSDWVYQPRAFEEALKSLSEEDLKVCGLPEREKISKAIREFKWQK